MPKPKSPRATVTCANCSAERQVTVSYHKRNVTGTFFCGNECRDSGRKSVPYKGGRGSPVTVLCDACGKPKLTTTTVVDRRTTGKFYCSNECRHTGHGQRVQKVTVTCAHCSATRQVTESYHAKSATGIFFCGNDCRLSYEGKIGRPAKRSPRIEVACVVCGKPKLVTPTYAAQRSTGRFFCSEECLHKGGSRPRTKELKTCEVCSTVFYPSGTNIGRFCTKECYDKWQHARSVRVTYTCKVCGSPFERKPSQVRDNAQWCSHECRAVARTKTWFEGRWHNGKPVRQNAEGYLLIFEPDEPGADKGGWVSEHRFVASQQLGRRLERHEQVHHVDGVKTNNDWSNLEVLDAGAHTAVTLREGSMRRRIAQKRIRDLEAELAALRGAID